jgi:iron complex transport system ATP-binding protein
MLNITQILTLDNLRIGFGSRLILPPLTAQAKRGELIAVIGRNGIGKSTLLRTIAGLQPSLGGDVLYSGKSIGEYSRNDLARRIGYISTEMIRVSNMRVYDLVALGRFPYTNWFGRIDSENNTIIVDAMNKTGISPYASRFISELSDGERQKAMIARILAQDTGIMVMDEPTAFLDIGSKFDILHLMHLLSQKSGKTIIFSTHDLNIALSQSDKIWLILEDTMIEGAPEDLLLQGAFDNLFDSPAVQYNPEHGTYSFSEMSRGEVTVSGEGIMMYYTRKALNRTGFTVIEGNLKPFLRVPSGVNKMWQFVEDESITEFGSLYGMLDWICERISDHA